jgi:hypothetical protein
MKRKNVSMVQSAPIAMVMAAMVASRVLIMVLLTPKARVGLSGSEGT